MTARVWARVGITARRIPAGSRLDLALGDVVAWAESPGKNLPEQETNMVFTQLLGGPMDFTPDPFQFIKDVPTDWSDTRVLAGEIDDLSVIRADKRGARTGIFSRSTTRKRVA